MNQVSTHTHTHTHTRMHAPDREVSNRTGAATPTASILGSVVDSREAAAGVSPELTVLDCLAAVGNLPL